MLFRVSRVVDPLDELSASCLSVRCGGGGGAAAAAVVTTKNGAGVIDTCDRSTRVCRAGGDNIPPALDLGCVGRWSVERSTRPGGVSMPACLGMPHKLK